MLSVGKVFGLLELQDNFSARLIEASKQLDTFGKRTEAIGRNVAQLGDRMTMGVTLPIVAMAGGAMKAAIDFESSFAGVRKTFDDTGLTAEQTTERLAQMSDDIRKMALEMPISANEINKVAEAAGQLGVKRDDILSFSKTMIMLGETTNLTADQAATSMARFANIMGTPTAEIDKVGSALVDLGNKGASTEAEILEMALRIAGAGKTIGLTEAEVLGMGNALSSLGIEAEMGGNAISKMMINIAAQVDSGGEKLDEFAKVAGMSADQFAAAFRDNAGDAIARFTQGLGQIDKNGGSLLQTLADLDINETRLRDTMLRVAGGGDLFAKSMRTGSEAMAENSALTKEYDERMKTAAAQIQLFKNRIYDLGITMGGQLVPHLLSILEALKPLLGLIETGVKLFAALPTPVQTFSLALLGIAAAAGPVLSIGGRMLELFGMLSRVLGFGAAASAAGGGLTGAVAGFGAVLSALVVPAALAGIAYGFTKIYDAIQNVRREWDAGRSGWGVLLQHDDNTAIRRFFGLNVNTPGTPSVPGAPRSGLPSAPTPRALPSDWMTNANAGVGAAAKTPLATYADDLRKWNAELSKPTVNLGLLKRAIQDNVLTSEQMSKQFGISSEAIKLFENRINVSKDVTKDQTKFLEQLAEQTEETARTWRLYDFEQELVSQSVRAGMRLSEQQVPLITRTKNESTLLTETVKDLGNATIFSTETIAKMNAEQDRASAVIAFATEKLDMQERSLYDAAGAFARFGQMVGGSVGRVINNVGGLVQEFAYLKKAQDDMMKSGTASWGQYAAMATSWAGAIIGGLSMVVGWLERNDKYVTQRINYIASAGGIFELRNRAATAGASGFVDALQRASGSGIQRAIENLNSAIQKGEERLSKYNLTWKDLGATVRQSNIDQIARSLLEDFRALGGEGANAITLMRDGFSRLIIDAVDTGSKIPAALQPMIEKLIRAGQLSEEAAAALLGIRDTGVPSLADITAAAERYGISLDALGPKVGQLRVNEAAAQIAADFELLIGLGGDSAEVLEKMSGKVQEVVTRALELGLEIPASMKPVIERMIDAGLLTDEFGEKLTDTARLNFAEVLAEKIDDLISKLGELIDKFSEVNSAAEQVARRRRELLSGVASDDWQDPREAPEPAQTGPRTPSPNTGIAGGRTTTPVVTGDVYIDGRRAGQLLAPHIGEHLAEQGVVS